MCAATTNPPSKSIGLYRTDEELIMLLVRMANGTPFPDDVIEVVNPYQFKPADLAGNSWFYGCLDPKEDSQHGFWKAKGEPSKILSVPSVIGLRTTLEFYDGRGPHAQRTNWVMQEYSITQKGLQSNNNLKGSKILFRVFLTSGTIENENLQQKLDGAESAGGSFFHEKPSVGPDTESNLRLSGSQARSRVDNIGGTSDGVKDLSEIDCIARGDYLELDDLVDPGSRSFSSDDSSCLTISSDECFDSLALLKDLEAEINKGLEAASAKSNEVIREETLGSHVGSGNESQTPNKAVEKRARDKRVAENATETQNAKNGDKKTTTSDSEDETSSSSSHKSATEGERKLSGRRFKKLKQKYLCFMPF